MSMLFCDLIGWLVQVYSSSGQVHTVYNFFKLIHTAVWIMMRVLQFTHPVIGVALWVLEVKIVLSLFTEFGRCDIHSYLDPPSVSGLLYGNANQLQTCSVSTKDI